MAGRFPIWVYVAVALLIALVAFGIEQLVPGLGMIVVAAGTPAWAAWNANRTRRIKQNG